MYSGPVVSKSSRLCTFKKIWTCEYIFNFICAYLYITYMYITLILSVHQRTYTYIMLKGWDNFFVCDQRAKSYLSQVLIFMNSARSWWFSCLSIARNCPKGISLIFIKEGSILRQALKTSTAVVIVVMFVQTTIFG